MTQETKIFPMIKYGPQVRESQLGVASSLAQDKGILKRNACVEWQSVSEPGAKEGVIPPRPPHFQLRVLVESLHMRESVQQQIQVR